KKKYLRAREEYINMLRGLPYDLPYNPRVKAIREMEAREAEINPLISGTSWTPIGPAPIPNGHTVPTKVAVSGRVSAIDVPPTNPKLVYVGTAQGGLYRTMDGANTWTPLFDQQLSLAIGAVAISPSSPSTVFVGTGEANLSADSFFGVGVY